MPSLVVIREGAPDERVNESAVRAAGPSGGCRVRQLRTAYPQHTHHPSLSSHRTNDWDDSFQPRQVGAHYNRPAWLSKKSVSGGIVRAGACEGQCPLLAGRSALVVDQT